MQTNEIIAITKDQVVSTAEKMREEGRLLVMIHGHLEADGTPVDKRDPLIVGMKDWIDQEYEDARQTAMTDKELHEMVDRLAPGRLRRV